MLGEIGTRNKVYEWFAMLKLLLEVYKLQQK